MKTLKLDKPWAYRTSTRTIQYPAGEYEVTNEIHDAAVAAGVVKEGKADGGRTAETGQAGAAGEAKG